MSSNKSKVAIIGTGFVGASAAFAMSLSQITSELVLIDVFKDKAEGEAMDINHGLSFLGQMSVYAGDYSDCKDCDVIVVTAGANRKPGETRIDLAKKNVAIAKEITANIMKHYTKGVILVVANPVDVMTYMIQKWSGLPEGKVFGSGTVLDSVRFRHLISSKLDVDVKNVHGYIIGEHGDTQLPAWSATHIAGIKMDDYCEEGKISITDEDKAAIMDDVRKAGAEIIKKKNATYYGIAVTINAIVESLLKNQKTIRTVSTVINNKFGINDVALSLPAIITSDGVRNLIDLPLTEEEIAGLKNSADALKKILDEVKDI